MLPRHLRASLLGASAVLALGLLAGCGGSDPAAAPDPAEVTTTAPATQTPAPTVTPAPTSTPATPGATDGPGDQVGDGDADQSAGPATAGGGVCGQLSADEVGALLGGTVTGSALGGVPGCTFTQADPRAYAATMTPAASMAAARDDAASAVEGDPENLSGVGTEAFVVTGTMFGGEQLQAIGAVHVGNRVVSVQLNQQKGLARAQVRDRLVALLKLVAREAG